MTPIATPAPDTMTAAELQCRMESLGITQATLAELLDVSKRAVQYWLAGRSPIPEHVNGDMAYLEQRTDQWVRDVKTAAAHDQHITVYRTDEELWAARPGTRPYPARWWRVVACRAAAQRPDARIDF